MTEDFVPLPTFGGWRNEQGDGPAGLSKTPLVVVMAATMAALILFFIGQLLLCLITLMIVAAVVLVSIPVKGLPASWYIRRDIRWLRATIAKRHRYESGIISNASLAPDGEQELPGVLANKRLAIAAAGFGSTNEWGLVVDEHTRQIAVSWVIDPPATDMATNQMVGTLTSGWAAVLNQVSNLPDVAALSVSTLTTRGTAEATADAIVAGIRINVPEAAADVMRGIAAMEKVQASSATTVIEATFRAQDGTMGEQVAAVTRNLPAIERSFGLAGIGAFHRSTEKELVHRVRQVFDPYALPGGHENWRSAGPVVLDDKRNFAAADEAAIVSFVLATAPTQDITPFALSPLLTPSEYPTRFTQTWRPVDPLTASRLAENARRPNVITLAIQGLHLKDETKAEAIEASNRDEIAEHQARGNSLGTMRMHLTTWIPDVADLESVTREIKSKAMAAGMQVRAANTMHASNACIGIGAGIIPGEKAA